MSEHVQKAFDQLLFEDGGGSDERLRELMLYISDKCLTDPTYGATKLNKILYFSDFEAYLQRGKPITGCEYMGLQQGPVPRRLMAVRESMEANHEAHVREQLFFGAKVQKRLIPMRNANLELFTAWDISLVDAVIKLLWGETARVVSDASHNRAWRIAGTDKDKLPYQSSFISDAKPTAHDMARFEKLAERHGIKLLSS